MFVISNNIATTRVVTTRSIHPSYSICYTLHHSRIDMILISKWTDSTIKVTDQVGWWVNFFKPLILELTRIYIF